MIGSFASVELNLFHPTIQCEDPIEVYKPGKVGWFFKKGKYPRYIPTYKHIPAIYRFYNGCIGQYGVILGGTMQSVFLSGGCLPPLWKICSSKFGSSFISFARFGVNIENNWNHHPVVWSGWGRVDGWSPWTAMFFLSLRQILAVYFLTLLVLMK